MRKQKSEKDQISEFAYRLKVCGHPLRLKILIAIEKGDKTCVKELWRCLKKSQPVISQHLAVLKELGIVKARIDKNMRFYSITDPFIKNIINNLMNDEEVKLDFDQVQKQPQV
jgi:DNA-binding transcriptional ArsR family regulator